MKTTFRMSWILALLSSLTSLVSSAKGIKTQRDGVHHAPIHEQEVNPDNFPQDIVGPGFEGPHSAQNFDQSQFDFQPQFSSYQSYQPNYIDPSFISTPINGVYEDSIITKDWVKQGLELLLGTVPVTLSAFFLVAVLSFAGFIEIPSIAKLSEAQETLSRALSDVDVDQIANTVELAIAKYRQLFPDP